MVLEESSPVQQAEDEQVLEVLKSKIKSKVFFIFKANIEQKSSAPGNTVRFQQLKPCNIRLFSSISTLVFSEVV